MSGMETKIGGETSQGNEDVPQPAPTAVRKRTGQISDGSDVIVDEEDRCSHFLTAVCKRPIPRLQAAEAAEAAEEVEGLFNTKEVEMDTWNSSYIIEITAEEVKSYTTNDTVKKKFNSLFDVDVKKPRQPKIEKAPLILRENINFQKYYKPRMVSIGPYHHGRPNLNMMEELKLKIAKLFVENIPLPIDYEEAVKIIYSKIRKDIGALKKFYEENAVKHFEDDELAWMFFLDGCLILHYIYCTTESMKNKKNVAFQTWNIKPDCLTFVKHDFFLLENQLPYRVLELIISCLNNEVKKEFPNFIEDFVFHSIKAQWEKHEKLNHKSGQNEGNKRHPKHLLDLLREKILQSDVKSTKSYSIVQHRLEPLEKIKDMIEYIGKALENFPRKQTEDLQFCRNVEELKAAGIRLKPNNTGCVTDIDFNLGTLKIHPIRVDDTTASMFLNLIAYEMTPNFPNDFGICSYIAFLDSLIDGTQDVKELRDEQILRNVLGSDEEVTKLFNEISSSFVPNPKKYSDVKKNIQKRYKNTWMTGIAQLIHEYFQSPWSVIAFLAAVAILALTVIQTVYTILGYY